MTRFLAWMVILAAVASGLWLMILTAKRQGKAEEQAREEANAREKEREMADEVLKPRDPDELDRRLSDGSF